MSFLDIILLQLLFGDVAAMQVVQRIAMSVVKLLSFLFNCLINLLHFTQILSVEIVQQRILLRLQLVKPSHF